MTDDLAGDAPRDLEPWFGRLIAAASVAMVAVDSQTRISFANRRAEALLGYGPGELNGQPLAVLVPERLREVHAREVAAFLASPRKHRMGIGRQVVGRRKDGGELELAIGLDAVDVPGGAVTLATIADPNERTRTAAQFKALFESAPIAMFALDTDGAIAFANGRVEAVFGYRPAEVLGRSLELVLPEGLAPAAIDDLQGARASYGRAKDGRRFPVELGVSTAELRDGPATIVSVIDDTSHAARERRADAALQASERRFRDLAESLPHMVWTCAGDGPCDYLSPQWVSYTGIPEAEQLGYAWLDQLHPDDRGPTQARWAEAAAHGRNFDTEFRVRRVDGAYRWFKTRAVPLLDASGHVEKWFGSNTDIQDLRDAQEAAARLNRELEERVRERTEELRALNAQLGRVATELRQAQTRAKIGTGVLDLTTGVSTWSKEVYAIFGLDPSLSPPRQEDRRHLYTPESYARTLVNVQRLFAPGSTEASGSEQYQVVRPSGEIRTVDIYFEVARDDRGRPERIIATLQDITEREEASAQLRRLTERLQLATSAAKMGVWDWDVARDTLTWDDAMYRLYGVEPSRFGGAYEAWMSRLHPDDRAASEGAIQAALARERPYETTFRIVGDRGEVRYIRAAATTHFDEAGKPVRMVGFNWDITEQREAELALRSSEALQRAIVRHAGSAIIATDPHGVITLFNHAAEELLGHSAAAVVGVRALTAFHEAAELAERRGELRAEFPAESLGEPFDVLVAIARTGAIDTREWTYVAADGARVSVLLTLSSVRDDAGVLLGYLAIAVDLGERKEQERRLVELNRLLAERTVQAEAASEAKSTFVANMSHEIRTPLGAIIGGAYLLGKTQLDVEQSGLIHMMEGSAKTLLAMINNILDLSKIEAKQLTLEVAPFALAAVVDDLAGMMAGFARGKDLELVVHADPNLPAHVAGDRARLMQVLANLAGNAIKFTDRGSVRVSLAPVARDATRLWLRCEVRDTGPGIPAEAVAKLFTRFMQAREGRPHSRGGTGLGLAIVKELVTLMGGEVGVDSTPQVGSTFWVELPFARAALPERIASLRPLSILVAHEHPEQRDAVAAAVAGLGWTAEYVSSGAQAVARALDRARLQRPFDAFLVDWQMPDLDGLQTLAAIRAALGQGAAPPSVVMVTAAALADLRNQPLAELAHATLDKPVTASSLFDAIVVAIQASTGARERLGPERVRRAGERLAGLRVLVVDDSAVNRDIASRILAREGATVEAACDGAEAIERIRRGTPPLDLVLMDVQMPELDGIEAVRRLRAEPLRCTIPVVALTAGALATERERALAAGMNDFIAKPFDPEALIDKVRQFLPREPGPFAERAVVGSVAAEGWPEIEGIVGPEVSERMGGDRELFLGLLATFVGDLDQLGRLLLSPALASVELRARVHTMKGAAGNLGAREVASRCRALEDTLALGEPQAASAAAQQLTAALARLGAAIRQALAGAAETGPH